MSAKIVTLSDCQEFHSGQHVGVKVGKKAKGEIKRKLGRPPKHGLSGSTTAKSYYSARSRCRNANDPRFADYGDRGIEFRFSSIVELVEAIGLRLEGTTLDRIDVNGHYEAGNVRWATPAEQAQNRRPPRSSRVTEDYRAEAVLAKRLRQENYRQGRIAAASCYRETVWRLRNMHSRRATLADDSLAFHIDPTTDCLFIGMPSVAFQGTRVIVAASPQDPFHPDSREITAYDNRDPRGIPPGMGVGMLEANVSPNEIEALDSWFVQFERGGACGFLYRGADQFDRREHLVERSLLSIAGNLLEQGKNVQVVTTGDILRYAPLLPRVDDLAPLSRMFSQPNKSPLLAHYLVILDMHVGHDIFDGWELAALLKCRLHLRLPTIAYASYPECLGSTVAGLLEANFMTYDLSCNPLLLPHAPADADWLSVSGYVEWVRESMFAPPD